MTTRRPRGNYASLICLRCRARKIKCVLPDDTVQPSDRPLPPDRSCYRCRQNGFECVVDSTTLGRPARKRRPMDARSEQPTGRLASPEEPTDMDELLLSQPWEVERTADSPHVPRDERYQVLLSPMHLLHALLLRSRAFASAIPVPMLASRLPSPLDLIDADLADLLDQHLVWHRLHFPYIPSLASLRQRAAPNDRSSMPAVLLFALLCELALDVPTPRLNAHRWLKPSLHGVVFHYGQAVMFYPPGHRDAVTALELIAEYRPLALVSSQYAAPPAVTGSLYIAAAKRVCQKVGLDTVAEPLRAQLDAGDESLEHVVLDALQWIHILTVEVESTMAERGTLPLGYFLGDEVKELFDLLKESMYRGQMPWQGHFLFNHLAARRRLRQTYKRISNSWEDLATLESIINEHAAACEQQRLEFAATLQAPMTGHQPADASVLTALLDANLHKFQSDVIAVSLYYAVMSGVYLRKQAKFQPDEVANISNHIIDRLKADDGTESGRHPVRIFLEKFGDSRMSDMERYFTNFASLAEGATLRGIPYVAPTRHLASDVLFSCKDMVENNAARLKGWGGFHERIDTQLILFQVCARHLEQMTESSKRQDAISQGNILAASAMLIRSLHGIMSAWKKKLAENQWRGVSSTSPSEMAASTGATQTLIDSNGSTETTWTPTTDSEAGETLPSDFFTDWHSWPQIESMDFVEFFQSDLDSGRGKLSG